MHLLMVNPNVVVGGAQKIMLYLAKGLEQRGHRVWILTTSLDVAHLPAFAGTLRYLVEDAPILQPGGELANFTALEDLPLLAVRLARLRRAILRAIREHRIDVVNPVNPPANWLCSFLPVPVVWSCLNNPMAFYRPLRRGYSALWPSRDGVHHRFLEAVYEGVDYPLIRFGITRIVSPSEQVSRRLRQVYGRESEVIVFVPSERDGIRRPAASQDVKFERMERDGLVVVQVGQLTEDKRPFLSLDVLERLRGRIPRVRLQFVGDGTLRAALEREVQRRRLNGQVEFLGYRGEDELAEIYAGAHVLFFPGAHQPMGIVPFEALAHAVVPIIADTSGAADVLARHGLTTVAASTAEAFAEQVCAVYERRATLGRWLSGIQASVDTELSHETFLERYEQVFAEARRGGSPA